MVSCREDPATGELVVWLNLYDVAQVERVMRKAGFKEEMLDNYVVAIVEAGIAHEEVRVERLGARR